MAVKLKNPKHIPKPYEQMTCPDERVQIDVIFVSRFALLGEPQKNIVSKAYVRPRSFPPLTFPKDSLNSCLKISTALRKKQQSATKKLTHLKKLSSCE